jgi:hypothetical protein
VGIDGFVLSANVLMDELEIVMEVLKKLVGGNVTPGYPGKLFYPRCHNFFQSTCF